MTSNYHPGDCACEICSPIRKIIEILPDPVSTSILINVITRILFVYNIPVKEFEETFLPAILATLQRNLEIVEDTPAPTLN